MVRLRNRWGAEIIAIVFSALCTVALAVLLAVEDGKPVFTWHGVTLNAIVALLAACSKAALLMAVAAATSQWKWILFSRRRRPLMDFERIDAASRGPWGTLLLLWHCKRAILLRIGALVALSAVAVDLFAQQLVQYHQDLAWTDGDSRTTLPRAERYSKGNEYATQMGRLDFSSWAATDVWADADFSMQSAVLYGLSQPLSRVSQQLTYNCPSGNCNWAPFQSLAVCSRCSDLTSQLERIRDEGAMYVYLMGSTNGAALAANGTAYRLPNGHLIDNLDGDNELTFGGVYMTTFGTPNASETNSMQGIDTLIWSMSVLKAAAAPRAGDASTLWPDVAVEATECALYYCVNNYTSSVRNGTLDENATRPAFTRNPQSWQLVEIDGIGTSPLNASFADSIAFNSVTSILSRTDLQLVSSAALFNISQNAVDSVSSYFQTAFADQLYRFEGPQYDNGTELVAPGRLNGFYMDDGELMYKPSTAQALWDSPDIAATFEAVAASMSNALRAGADNGTLSTGATGLPVTYYRVEWAWLALQLALLVGGALFLGLTAWENGAVPVWKGSALAAMSRGAYVGDALEDVAEVGEMEKRAREEVVALFDLGEAGDGYYSREEMMLKKDRMGSTTEGEIVMMADGTPPQPYPGT